MGISGLAINFTEMSLKGLNAEDILKRVNEERLTNHPMKISQENIRYILSFL